MILLSRKEILQLHCRGSSSLWSCEKNLGSLATPALEVKVERANLTRDARKWQAVIKSGERELRRVPRRSKKRLSCSRPVLSGGAVGTSFGFRQ